MISEILIFFEKNLDHTNFISGNECFFAQLKQTYFRQKQILNFKSIKKS